MVNKEIKYYNTNRVVDEGELVITTKNPSDKFYRACFSVDRERDMLAGVLVTGDCQLCAMDVTRKQDLEEFVDGVAHIFFFKPVGGIVYKLPKEKAEGLRATYKKASIEKSPDKVRSLLDSVGMKLTGGIISSMSFVPRGEINFKD